MRGVIPKVVSLTTAPQEVVGLTADDVPVDDNLRVTISMLEGVLLSEETTSLPKSAGVVQPSEADTGLGATSVDTLAVIAKARVVGHVSAGTVVFATEELYFIIVC